MELVIQTVISSMVLKIKSFLVGERWVTVLWLLNWCNDGMIGFFSPFVAVVHWCVRMKNEYWGTILNAPVPISLVFHSLAEKQKVCAANSAGSLSQSKHLLSKREKKTECNFCLPFKSQGEILCGLSFFPFKSQDEILCGLSFFFPTVLYLWYCQHVLWHEGLLFPKGNCPSLPFSSSSSPGGFKSQDNLLLLPNSPLKFNLS